VKKFNLLIFLILLSCSGKNASTINNIEDIDINKNLSFNKFKELIEKKGLSKGYPNINK
tara:strand:+ start:1523 stop:1699 length:177 start_codon:yes stop_codon:yes gene_type:complete